VLASSTIRMTSLNVGDELSVDEVLMDVGK
jgi:hypothetical protein